MISSSSKVKLQRMRPPVRRVLALDAGTRRWKLLLAQSDFGRLRIVREELIDLQGEGLVSPEETKAHLEKLLAEWGKPPLALVLPQHLSISQIIDLPPSPESEVDKLIAEESIKLSGVSQSRIVYDFVRIEAPSTNRQQFWVTLCQEGDIRERIQRLGVEHEDICEVTTTASALVAAYGASAPDSTRAIVVHLGAQTTVIVILLDGQGAFATSFQMGAEFFTRALARERQCSEEKAESLKREVDLLAGPRASAEFRVAVDGWAAELKRQLSEWFHQNSAVASEAASFDLIAGGGGFDQPGLMEYLKTKAEFPFQPWPTGAGSESGRAGRGLEVAFGTALQALGYSPQPVSLLPQDYREAWRKHLNRQRLEWASVALLFLCALVLAFGTWRNLSLISSQEALLATVKAGQETVEANDLLTGELLSQYEALRPVFAAQQNTLDALRTLSLLQQSKSNHTFWFVLLADQQSYFSQAPALLSTNRPAKTNLLVSVGEPVRPGLFASHAYPAALTNAALAKPGFIAELCVPGDAEGSRQALSELVNGLKQQRLFSKVDLLSDDLRRSLADPKVTILERDFVLALDFAETDFLQPARAKKTSVSGPRGPVKRIVRPASWTEPETAGDMTRDHHE
jgi:Tfp pilus assembly PilM family ATPase